MEPAILPKYIFVQTWVGGFFLNYQRLQTWTEGGDVTEIEPIALDFETPELSADFLQAGSDVLHHDVLQG